MKKVMLIDDDEVMNSLLSKLLEIEGFTPIVNTDMEWEALSEKLQKETPDALIMDVHLKDVDGIDIMRKIRFASDLGSIKVLMTSGLDMHEECLQAGANGFMAKPFMPADLINWLKEELK
ncbi:MAG TPA: response regulator [Longilinea sp.]|nr:response regulator [Longilinea sp.]